MAVQGKAPYKSVLTHGFVFGEDGRKMSKSLGNYIRPDDIIKNYGADILRLWAASVDYRNDTKIGDNIIKQLAEIFKKTRNTARFLLGNIFDFNPQKDYVKYEELKPIDKFALHKLNKVVEEVTVAFDNYEFYKYFQCLQNFAAVDLSSFYLDIVKDRLYTAGKKSLSRRACQTVLYETLQVLVRILTPVMPHQAEDIWQNTPEIQRGGLESILLANWPVVNKEWNNPQLEEDFAKILKTREVVTRAIEPLRADKKIGSSLEVGVYVKSGDADVLKANAKELADIFITSQAYVSDSAPEGVLNEYTENGITVWVVNAEGEKCEHFKKTNIFPGGFSEKVFVSEEHLQNVAYLVPENMPDEEISFYEPLGCCIRAIKRCALQKDDTALIVGLGSIGLLMGEGLKAMGYKVYGCDLIPERIELAKKMGIEPFDFSFEVDGVFMTSGADKAIDTALKAVRAGGKILVFSSTPLSNGYPNNEIYYKELTVLGSYSPSPADLKDSFDLLASGKVNVKGLTTVYPLDKIQQAFDDTVANKIFKAYIKIAG